MTQRIGMFPLFILACLVYLGTGCQPKIPTRDFTPRELLVDPSWFPSDWRVVSGPRDAIQNRRQIDGAYLALEIHEPFLLAQHEIFRYSSKQEAHDEFTRQIPEEFFQATVIVPWRVPNELPYASPVADQFRFACAVINLKGRTLLCDALGQYDEYISTFSIAMDLKYMTFTDLEYILKRIDERMARALGKPLPPSVAPP